MFSNDWLDHHLPWEPITFIFRGYNPNVGGLKPAFFHGFFQVPRVDDMNFGGFKTCIVGGYVGQVSYV